MTNITAGDRLVAADDNVCVPSHRLDVIPSKAADFLDEDAPTHSLEARLGRPARLLLELQPCTCRWLLGDLDDPHFQWCGCPCMTGAPYCAAHMWLARPPSQRKASEMAHSG
jgi:GcrA cell cycle regulator